MRKTQCGNSRIFLKSILVILKLKKVTFWPYKQLWILNFWHFQVWNFPKNQNSKPPNCQNDSLWLSKISQNWFHVKSDFREAGKWLNSHTLIYPQSKFPIGLPRSVHPVDIYLWGHGMVVAWLLERVIAIVLMVSLEVP